MLYSYLDLNFVVLHAASSDRFVDNNGISLVNLDPSALLGIYKLTTSSGKHLEDIRHAHIVSLLYKLITRGSDNLSIGFDRDRGRRQRELINNKTQKGIFHLRNMLKDVFGFAEYQGKATFGLGYKLTSTKIVDNAVLIKGNTTNIGKIKINSIDWFVPHFTAIVSNQAKLSQQILSKTPTELQNVERSVFMKEINTQNL